MKTPESKHSLEDHDLGELAKTQTNARARTRLYILHQYRIGNSSEQIAHNLNINNLYQLIFMAQYALLQGKVKD